MNTGPARVLEGLRDARDGPCSGESLSHHLGVSRAQIWKPEFRNFFTFWNFCS